MTAITPVPTNLQWVGIAAEVTYGTPIAAPTAWIPVEASSLKYKPNQKVLDDAALRGLMSTDFQQVQGMRFDTLDYTSYVYLDSVYQHFLSLFGKPDAVTGTANPYTHKTSVENGADQAQAQPKSYTLFWFDGVKCVQIPGALAGALKLSVKVDELATIAVTWTGLKGTVMGSAPANTPSTAAPMPAWNATITTGGTATSRFSSLDLDYKREVAEVETIAGSQAPLEIFGGAVSATGTLTAIYEGAAADTDLTAYLANTQAALTVQLAPVGDTVHSLTLQHSVTAYDSADPSGSNKWMEIASQVKCLANATDALDGKQSLGQVIMVSAAATYS